MDQATIMRFETLGFEHPRAQARAVYYTFWILDNLRPGDTDSIKKLKNLYNSYHYLIAFAGFLCNHALPAVDLLDLARHYVISYDLYAIIMILSHRDYRHVREAVQFFEIYA